MSFSEHAWESHTFMTEWADEDIGGCPVQVVAVGVPKPHCWHPEKEDDTCILAWHWPGNKRLHMPKLREYTMNGVYSPGTKDGSLDHCNLKPRDIAECTA